MNAANSMLSIDSSILQALTQRKHVPLFHFTDAGLRAQKDDRLTTTDTSLIPQVINGTLVMKSRTAMDRRVKQDEFLSIAELREAQEPFIAALLRCGWDDNVVTMWDDFIYNIVTHSAARNSAEVIGGQHPLVMFFASSRKLWHDALRATLPGQELPSVGQIHEAQVQNFRTQLQTKAFAQSQSQQASVRQAPAQSSVSAKFLVHPHGSHNFINTILSIIHHLLVILIPPALALATQWGLRLVGHANMAISIASLA